MAKGHEQLLKLVAEPLTTPITCDGGSCKGCVFESVCNKQRCGTDGSQRVCNRDCNDCGGGPQYQFGGVKKVPGVCCKSPLGPQMVAQVRKDEYAFTKRPLLKFKQRHVVMHHGLFGGKDVDLFPSDTEVVGVNLRHVWTTRGWHSRDFKDFLKVPKSAKLILFSCTYDDVLERAWEHEVHHEDFVSLGFDYWELYELSLYPYYGNFFNLWSGYRTLYAGEASGSWFGQQAPWCFDNAKGMAPYKPWVDWSEAVPQITVNWQFVPIREEAKWLNSVGILRRVLKRLPAIKALWFQGVASGPQVFNLRRAFPDHELYFISSSPWMRAQQRKEFTATGGYAVSNMERLDLLLQNQANYANLVRSALDAADSSLKRERKAQRST